MKKSIIYICKLCKRELFFKDYNSDGTIREFSCCMGCPPFLAKEIDGKWVRIDRYNNDNCERVVL